MIKAGLLICDHVEISRQAKFGDYGEMFAKLFPNWSWRHYEVTKQEIPERLDECQVYLCTGSRKSVYEELDWIPHVKDLIREIHVQKIKFIGVCFGHQIMAEALGGKVEKAASGWSAGIGQMLLLNWEPWMDPYYSMVPVPMMCQDQVVTLPDESVLLGTMRDCPNAFFRVGDHMLGIQGHPEFSHEFLADLLTSRKGILGAERSEKGLRSLDIPGIPFFQSWVETFVERAI